VPKSWLHEQQWDKVADSAAKARAIIDAR